MRYSKRVKKRIAKAKKQVYDQQEKRFRKEIKEIKKAHETTIAAVSKMYNSEIKSLSKKIDSKERIYNRKINALTEAREKLDKYIIETNKFVTAIIILIDKKQMMLDDLLKQMAILSAKDGELKKTRDELRMHIRKFKEKN